jgi:hypothetical protein
VFDCTVPYRLKENFRRVEFAEVDLKRFFPDGLGPGPEL